MARSAKPRKRKSSVHHAEVPRYVVKLHEDDETGEDAPVLRFDGFDDAVDCCADLDIPELLSNLVYEAIRQRSDLMFHLPPVRRL